LLNVRREFASRQFLTPPSRQAEKCTASRDYTRQPRTDDGARNTRKAGVGYIGSLRYIQCHEIAGQGLTRRGENCED
jgi:hypothetical protein